MLQKGDAERTIVPNSRNQHIVDTQRPFLHESVSVIVIIYCRKDTEREGCGITGNYFNFPVVPIFNRISMVIILLMKGSFLCFSSLKPTLPRPFSLKKKEKGDTAMGYLD